LHLVLERNEAPGRVTVRLGRSSRTCRSRTGSSRRSPTERSPSATCSRHKRMSTPSGCGSGRPPYGAPGTRITPPCKPG